MKPRHLFLLSLLLVAIFGLLAVDIKRDKRYDLAKREILLRQIGHRILLHSGDSISRVLPVTKLPDEKYQLVFDRPFTFETDTLVDIVRKTLTASGETSGYLVKVMDCPQSKVVYGYSVSQNRQEDVIPCSGRKQQTGCYVIAIEFQGQPFGVKTYAAGLSAIAALLLFPLAVARYRKQKSEPKPMVGPKNQHLAIGRLFFDPDRKQLHTANQVINLTSKESKILYIFAQHPNQVIDRTRLQKEIWEDDGVIVGRSLDVFISKLRKKLESDPNVQLSNIHGKGYKLQIGTTEKGDVIF
ncbi:winged helix-turn-helix domain-containing protein [Flavobacterium sp.]|uniref:winged helix-turn-helix domain-containing protein n=1 Tax=Flavobacterium sp. TaxID=239 RepID=UPI0039E727D9